VTAPLALGCESGGHEAENEAPASENPGRTEQTLDVTSKHRGTMVDRNHKGRRRVRTAHREFTRLNKQASLDRAGAELGAAIPVDVHVKRRAIGPIKHE
jgi:hypothetical protein